MSNDPGEDDVQKRIILVFLKIFHIFTCVIGDMNDGNTDLVQSILRDYSEPWDDFYKSLFPYFEKFYTALKTMEGLRIIHEYLYHEGKYVVRIEYTDGWEKEYLNMKDLALVRSADRKSIHGESKTIHPSHSISSLPMTILNFFIPSIFKENPDPSKTKVLRRARIQRTSSKPKLLAIEPPPEDPKSNEFKMKALCANEENDGNISDAEEVTENLLKSPDKVTEPLTSSHSYFDDIFEALKPANVENSDVSNNMEQNEMIGKLMSELELGADFESKSENIRKDLEYEEVKLKNETKVLHSPPPDLAESDDKENEEFKKKLEEILKKNKEELEQKRREREENRQKMDDEFKDLRQKQKQGFAVLMQCIQLRQRFEEKEEEWSDWIRIGFRRPIEILINQFASFQDELGGDTNRFLKLLEAAPEVVHQEVPDLERKLEASLSNLSDVFDILAEVGDDLEDAMFIRILQKSACDIAAKIIGVLEILDNYEYSEEWFEKINARFMKINPNEIPGTKKLKLLCKDGNMEGLKMLNFPKWERRSFVRVEEVLNDREEDEEEEEVLEDQSEKELHNLEGLEPDRSNGGNRESSCQSIPNMEDVKAEHVQDQLSNSYPVSIENKSSETVREIEIKNSMVRMGNSSKRFCEESNVILCGDNNRPENNEEGYVGFEGSSHPANGYTQDVRENECVELNLDAHRCYHEEILINDEKSVVSKKQVCDKKETVGESGTQDEEGIEDRRDSSFTDEKRTKENEKNLVDSENLETERLEETNEESNCQPSAEEKGQLNSSSPASSENETTETVQDPGSVRSVKTEVVALVLSNGNDRNSRIDDECDVDSEGNNRKDYSYANESSVGPKNQFHHEETLKSSETTLRSKKIRKYSSSTSSYRKNQSSHNTPSRNRSSTNPDETQFSRIRSQILFIYEDFENGDKFPHTFKQGQMKIFDTGKDSEIRKIWNRIVERTTRFLDKKEFIGLVNSKLPDILKEFEQVTNC